MSVAIHVPLTVRRATVTAAAPRLLFAGGGTGGHLLPGIACAEAAQALCPGTAVTFLGTGRPLEARLLGPRGFAHAALPAAPPSLRPLRFARFAWRTLRGALAARRAVAAFAPDLVIGLGGYGCVAPVLAARWAGIPTVLFEANALPGSAVRFLAPGARAVFIHFAEAALHLPQGRARLLGSPLRRELLAASAADAPFPPGVGPALLVLGGSLGARAVNAACVAAMPALARSVPGLRVLHLTGSPEAAAICGAAYATAGIPAVAMPFLDAMGAAYRAADLVVARAGGMTVAELAATGTPALLVPLPTAKDDHQRRNAEALARRGAARVCEEATLAARLPTLVGDLLRDPGARAAMATAARAAGRPDAAFHVAEACLALAAPATRVRNRGGDR